MLGSQPLPYYTAGSGFPEVESFRVRTNHDSTISINHCAAHLIIEPAPKPEGNRVVRLSLSVNQQAGKEARRVADEAAATGHSKLLALQQKQEEVLADMQAAQRDQERWRAQCEAEKQALQQEHDALQRSIQASLCTSSSNQTCPYMIVHSNYPTIDEPQGMNFAWDLFM